MKGRTKQAAGAVLGDMRLEREGKIDRAAGGIKQAAEEVVDKLTSAIKHWPAR